MNHESMCHECGQQLPATKPDKELIDTRVKELQAEIDGYIKYKYEGELDLNVYRRIEDLLEIVKLLAEKV